MVSASVVQAIEGQNWAYGLRSTGRGSGNAHPTTDGLDEAHRGLADLRLRLDVRQVHGREADRGRANAHRGCADMPLSEVAAIDNLAVLDLDERAQLVRLPEAVRGPQLLEIGDLIRRRISS